MEHGFDGIIPTIQHRGNKVSYDSMDFNIKNLTEIFKQDRRPREMVIPVSAYFLALWHNDKEQIDYHEKRFRIDKFRELKRLIEKWGLSKAKVIAWLNKKDRNASFMQPDNWSISEYDKWEYLGIGKGEMETVRLNVSLKEERFTITLTANDSDGYCPNVYTKILSKNISFNSIINQIKYFSKRLENNAY